MTSATIVMKSITSLLAEQPSHHPDQHETPDKKRNPRPKPSEIHNQVSDVEYHRVNCCGCRAKRGSRMCREMSRKCKDEGRDLRRRGTPRSGTPRSGTRKSSDRGLPDRSPRSRTRGAVGQTFEPKLCGDGSLATTEFLRIPLHLVAELARVPTVAYQTARHAAGGGERLG